MMIRFARSWPLVFSIILLLTLHIALAAEPLRDWTVEIGGLEEEQTSHHPAPVNDAAQIPIHHASPDERLSGVSSFHQAFQILGTLQRTPRRATRFSKPSGMVGSTVYYARELFFLLFMNGPPKTESLGTHTSSRKISEPLINAVQLLDEAAGQDNADALFTLAEMNFYGYYSHPRNYTRAFEQYSRLATLDGNATAQHMVGFMYATGIGGATTRDQARALLYHTFAADAGDVRSQMTVAFRYHAGIGTVRDCEKSVHHYKLVADKAMEFTRSGPPGGRLGTKEVYRLADEEGGLYGDGASVSSSGFNARQGTNAEATNDFDNVLEYMDFMARKGELKATFNLGKLHYDGSRGLRPDFKIAREYMYDVARRYWTKEGKVRPDTEPGVDKLASKAAGYLGKMFLRGEGMSQNFAKARVWFSRGVENGDALSQYSLGLMHLSGLGVAKDPVKAADYFAAAADQDLSSAQVALGELLMDQGDLTTAAKYFELASRHAEIQAFYYLAEISNLGAGRERNCNNAALFYKIVSEKADPLHSRFEEANEAYEARDLETALPLYMMAAEQGYEAGQVNVAHLLDQSWSSSPIARLFSILRRKASYLLGDATLALTYWTRSAKQMNIDSLVKVGDYYLLGLGTDNLLPDPEKAATCYHAAAETMQSAQAMWNLGWMHENGIGMEQDFHLAKRFYDQSADTNKEAYAPVTVALFKLRIRSWWNWVSGGAVKGIRDDELPKKHYTWTEWLAAFITADLEQYEADLARAVEEQGLDEWDTSMPGGDYDYFEGGPDGLWLDNDMLEAFIILGLAATLAFLVYWRQQRNARQRPQAPGEAQIQPHGQAPPAAQAQQPPPAEDGGFFPNPGDPEFLNWAMGGVGR